jgi:hypothetical protein
MYIYGFLEMLGIRFSVIGYRLCYRALDVVLFSTYIKILCYLGHVNVS